MLEVGLSTADDAVIWETARADGRIVVTKDEDFLLLATRPCDTGRMVWVRVGNCRNAALIAAFDRARDGLVQALDVGQRVIELR